ncbi:MAG: CapA family protein [Deltaproteobacteria bacterium]|jgi:poly-gamma-glutamate synthesis protein (capsule biosynthesis protein)|nr:CapA family protein [Deltaproteobacteria bacterium]
MKPVLNILSAGLLLLLFALLPACGTLTSPPAPTRARMIFIGDIMVHQNQLDAAKKNGTWDFKPHFSLVKPFFYNAFVVGNLETVFAGEKQIFSGYPRFNAPDELADALSDLGVNLVTLANNHILDRKPSGAIRTAKALERYGIQWTGLAYGNRRPNEALVLEYAGLRWAFVNFTYGSNEPVPSSDDKSPFHLNIISDETIKEGLLNARAADPDITVACFHWGVEYRHVPTKQQREVVALSIREGADLVIGTHPHVLQPVEIIRSEHGHNLVAYSLGNFVSSQRTPPRERSLILAVDVVKNEGETARISMVSIAPTQVSYTRLSCRDLIEVVYAGENFNQAGLTQKGRQKAQRAGTAVLDFIGAATVPDQDGFYTLWSADAPDILPQSRRKTPE